MIKFGKRIDEIRSDIDHRLSKNDASKKKVMATGLWLLLMSSIRVGNRKYLKENGTYGMTTLQRKHIKLTPSKITLDFVGKKKVQNYVEIKIPNKGVYKWLKRLYDDADPYFIEYKGVRVNSKDLNDYIKEYYGKFTAKDFRTWGANIIFLNALEDLDTRDLESTKDINKALKQAIEHTAGKLNNTPTVLKNNYLCQPLLELFKKDPKELVRKIRKAKNIDKLLITLI